jgi:alpha-L-rhamnosidase
MKRWVNSLTRRAREKMSWGRWLFTKVGSECGDLERYILDTDFSYGEWLRAGSGIHTMIKDVLFPSAAVSTAYLAHSTCLLSNIANILGKQEGTEHYLALSTRTLKRGTLLSSDNAVPASQKTTKTITSAPSPSTSSSQNKNQQR